MTFETPDHGAAPGVRNGMPASELGELGWERPWSGPNGGQCVELKRLSDGRVAVRLELYVSGVERANALSELTAPAEQRRRFEADMDMKEKLYGERYPLDEDFLAAVALMPDCAGIALGFDRLVMLATGARKLEDVLWLPVAPVA